MQETEKYQFRKQRSYGFKEDGYNLQVHINHIISDDEDEGWEIIEVKGYYSNNNPVVELLERKMKENGENELE